MPTYILPEGKESREEGELTNISSPEDYQRRVSFPVDDEILSMMSVGEQVEVMLVGEVVELSSHDSTDQKSKSLTIKVKSVSAYGDGESFEKGFDKGYSEQY